MTDWLFDKVYENFVEEVDGIDNGIENRRGLPRSVNGNLIQWGKVEKSLVC